MGLPDFCCRALGGNATFKPSSNTFPQQQNQSVVLSARRTCQYVIPQLFVGSGCSVAGQ
jgi:hypothetical protein